MNFGTDILTETLELQDFYLARKRIEPYTQKTPLVYSKKLSQQLNANIYLKYEHFHESGSFKYRGALNALNNLTEAQKQKGVITFSTGNHGYALALAAKKLNIRAIVCVSKNVPRAKTDRMVDLGTELEIYGNSQDEAEARCYELAKSEGFMIIPPFDHLDIIAGQGTTALEIIEDLPNATDVIAGLSGGGLVSGIGAVMKKINPEIGVIGISMEHGAAMHESLKQGRPTIVDEPFSLADSLLGGIGDNNQYTFNFVRQYMDYSILISEECIKMGMAYLYKEHKIAVEGAAAVGVGALLNNKVSVKEGANIVVIISGSNVDLDTHYEAVRAYLD